MPALTTANLLAYVLQIAAIVAIGAGLPLIVRLTSPRARLVYWRTLLTFCLVLPLVQPLTPPSGPVDEPAAAASFESAIAVAGGAVDAPASPPDPTRVPWPAGRIVAAVILVGMVSRFAWLGMGLVTLGRLRRLAARLLPRPPAIDEACLLTGADAEFRVASTVTRPVTFGALRPVVVVPDAYTTFDERQQVAVACHELVHVRRRDWLRTVADEAVRSVFWFHPALWWLLDQIHLTAEQVVDQEVVAMTGARQPYLEALVRLAVPPSRLSLRPASLFIRRSHLRERVTLLLKEVSMSRPRLAVSFVAMAAALMVSGRLVVAAFPLQGAIPAPVPVSAEIALPEPTPAPAVQPAAVRPQAAQPATPQGSVRPGEPVPQPVKPRETVSGLTKIHDVRPVYPPEAAAAGVSGAVIMTITIDSAGLVTDAKILRGDVTLADAAVDAVRQWRYRPPKSAPVVATVAVNVVDTDQPASAPDGVRVGGDVKAPTKIKHVAPVYPAAARKAGVQGVVIAEAKIDAAGVVANAQILRSVPMLDVAALESLLQWRFTPTVLNGAAVPVMMTVTVNFVLDSKPKSTEGGVAGGVPGGVGGGVSGGVPGGVAGDYAASMGEYQRQLDASKAPQPPEGALRVGGGISAPKKIRDARPVYPEDARAAGVQGIVIVEAVIGKDGKVESATVLRGIPMLDQAALDAVRQWEFTPTFVNGAPVSVIVTMTVNFTLQ